jgi:hypothetical protein
MLLDIQYSGLFANGTGQAFCLQEFIVIEHPGSILEAGHFGQFMGRVSGFLTISF